MLIPNYNKTTWIDEGPSYGEKEFNNIENEIELLNHYAIYK